MKEIATKYLLLKKDKFVDNNEPPVQREILGYHTLPDKMGVPALYVATCKDDLGYLVISADWRHEPICAVVGKGTYPNVDPPSMLIEWFETTLQNIELIRYYGFDNSTRSQKAWKAIDDDLGIDALVIPNDECCKNCPNYPDCKLDVTMGCGGDSKELCYGITTNEPCGNWTYKTVGPLMTTTWGQHCDFNNLCEEIICNGALLNCPNNCSQNPLTGCEATAMAQVIRYWEIPTSYLYDYANMPNNTGNEEVQRLMYDAGCSVNMLWGCGYSGAKGYDAPIALKNEFNFASANRDSYNGNHQTIVDNLANNQPVLLEGCRTKKTFLGITYGYSNCHEWVCDGYFESKNQCYSYLQLHMNWGWHKDYDGFFAFNDWNITGINRNYQYAQYYVHDIKP